MRVVQLFNAERPREANAPDHRRAEAVLAERGITTVTLPLSEPPWNVGPSWHNAFRGLDPFRGLRLLFGYRDADLVCAHMESAVVPLLLRRLFGFRAKIVIWELQWSPGWRYREFLSRLAIPLADCSVVFGSSQIALTRALYGADLPVVCVPFCIDTDFYRPNLAPPVRDGLFSCGFDEGRDFATLLRACEGLDMPVTLKTGKALPEQANVTQLRERLSWMDFRALYDKARIVVVATKDTPNASGVTSLMEAMAMGRPTIVTDNPALHDYFAPPDALKIVPVGDPDAMREAILELWNDPEKAEAMGRKAREFAEREFSPRRHFERMADLFEALVS